jgi:hypothetical protein
MVQSMGYGLRLKLRPRLRRGNAFARKPWCTLLNESDGSVPKRRPSAAPVNLGVSVGLYGMGIGCELESL